ncbi:MAG: Ig-like domain-containing protein [Acidobacteriia bacterium]|nr:Ig-like domain-containing protein [Terriglobia bacterium]
MPIIQAIVALLAASALGANTTLTFRNGVSGYTGGADVSINTQYSQYNGGNGIQWTGDPELGCYTTTGSGAYSVRYLLKFGSLSIPAGSQVVSAALTISIDNWDSRSSNITGFYLKNSWDPASNKLGWLHRSSTGDWAGPGASSAGVDTIAGKTFQVPALRPVGTQTVTIALDPDVVQAWIDTPAADQGIMLVNNIPGYIVNPVSTAGKQNMRPMLTVVVASGAPAVSVTVSPSTATVPAGGQQTFTASVTGSSNSSVTWTASGGTISGTGVYTAGAAPGSFTVTATSVADPTKAGTATITIPQPQPVQVSVSPTSATLQSGQTWQFTATVTGSSNTAVTWTAAGGTISNNGLFAAGSTAGSNFFVTATSVADSTKTASASVTIQSPPAVSVTVSPTSATLQSGGTQQFTAAVTGSSNTAVTWTATGGTISSTGLYTAGASAGNFGVTAKSVADPTKTATASVHINTTTTVYPPVPRMFDGPYVVTQSPVSGMHFTAPATIHIYADAFDGGAADPDALTVRFLMNGQQVGTYVGDASRNGYWALTVNNVAAGTYTITTQITSTASKVVNSWPVTVYVDNPAASSGPVFNLTANVVLSGSQTTTYAGTPANHCAINGNGFQIRSVSGFTGSLNIRNCDIRGLGTATNPSIDVTVNGAGSVQLTGNVFDTFGTVSIGTNDQAQAVVRNNEFRENTLVPVTSLPTEYANQTLPVFHAIGNSTAQQFFQGNNVGLSTVVFENTRNWLIGGNTDAESNVLMGVRCGFTISGSSNMVLRGNYSQHNYPHRFSQGDNFQLDGDGFLAEHNVIRSSSWPVRGFGGELRYNLIDASGNSDQIIQGPLSNANMHHNIITFTVSQTYYSPGTGLRVMYNVDNVQFHNNVMDGGGAFMAFSGTPVAVLPGAFIGSLRNNVFYNFADLAGSPFLAGDLGESTNPPLARVRYADYNDFYNPDAPNQLNYGLGVVGKSAGSAGYGMHDLGGFNGHLNPKFKQPTTIPFPFLPEDIWTRTKKVSDVLSTYRLMYTPAAGSPLLGAGDPQDGQGGNIGAVGNGEPADQFGLFGGGSGTPASPVISSFTTSPSSVQSGQSTTLNWSVTGATTFSISPGVGTVTGNSLTITPAATTTYTLTATNAGGSAIETATVTVNTLPQPVSISISPTSTTVFTNGTQQFTATVTNAANTSVTWSATGGTISSFGLYTAGSATGSFTAIATSVQDPTKSASATITLVNPTTSAHPRIILDAPTLATLRGRAQAHTAEWTTLKSTCDSYIGGTVEFINGNDYPDRPNVGEGYQGDGYVAALMPLGLCYQTIQASDPATAAKYATAGVAILMAMSDPTHQTADDCNCAIPLRDDGYGIRNFGFGMGMGYDWFHDRMTPAQLTQLQTALSQWFTTFETDPKVAFEYEIPQGNYYAGYYVAKCVAALAVQGDAAIGDTWWNDWYNHEHLGRTAPYYRANLAGGGWTEGYAQYGILATRNQSLPALAVKTAKGIDLIQAGDPNSSYTYPLDNPRWLMAFTWPTRDLIDDRGELYGTGDPRIWPGTGRVDTYRFSAGLLAMLGDPMAPMMHRYARDAKTALDALGVGDSTDWIDFLFWDPNAPETSDYSSLPVSYLAPGMGGVTTRSDWSTSGTFMSFMSGPYINNPGAGHEAFDKGSLAIERNKNPLVVNPDAWLSHDPNGDPGWSATYDDRFGNWDVDHTLGNRILYNTFQLRHVDATGGILDNYGQWALQRSDFVRTKIGRYEDGGSYVLTVGQFLEDMYRPFNTICAGNSPVTSWSRQILYLRPSQFVVYDRTGICNASLDQYLAFHFPSNPVEVPPPGPGLHRFDINTGQFAGSMTTILPANAAFVTTDRVSTDPQTWNKLWRTEIRPTDAAAATRQWLTVFDLAGSSAQVAAATPLTILSGPAVGALLQSSSGNTATVFGTAPVGTAIAGALSYVVPAAQTRHVITDLVPLGGYTVSVTISGANHLVTVTPGGRSTASAEGVFSFAVTPGELLQP